MSSTSENLGTETVKEEDKSASWYETSVVKRPKIDMELCNKNEYPREDNLTEMLKPLNTVENLKSPMDGLISNDVNTGKSFCFDNRDVSPAKSDSPELILFNSSDSFLDDEDALDIKTELLDTYNCGSVDQNAIIQNKSNSINGNTDPNIYNNDKSEQYPLNLGAQKNFTYHDIPLPTVVLTPKDSKSSLLGLVSSNMDNDKNEQYPLDLGAQKNYTYHDIPLPKAVLTPNDSKSSLLGLVSSNVDKAECSLVDNTMVIPSQSCTTELSCNSIDSSLDFENSLRSNQSGILKKEFDTIHVKIEPLSSHLDLNTPKENVFKEVLEKDMNVKKNNGMVKDNRELLNKSDKTNATRERKPILLQHKVKNELGHVQLDSTKIKYTKETNSAPQQIEETLEEAKFVPQQTEETNYVSPQAVFEKEKIDIVDPRWESEKELKSNEQRYKHVKKCWGSSTVPDPDKNLTYHSFRRKKCLRSGGPKEKVQQRKRKATTSLNNETKKPCTYLVDKEIHKVELEKAEEKRELQFAMKRAIDQLKQRQIQEEISYGNNMGRRIYGNNFFTNSLQDTFISNLRREQKMEINVVKNTYDRKAYDCDSKYVSKLEALKGIREEVLQFYKFYKGLGSNAEKDPTILTNLQLKMLDDVESFYKQMKNFYK